MESNFVLKDLPVFFAEDLNECIDFETTQKRKRQIA